MTDQITGYIENVLPQLQGWCSQEKAKAMAELIVEAQPELVVEIGVFGARSLIPQALAVKANGKGHVYGIDPWTVKAALAGGLDHENAGWWSTVNMLAIMSGAIAAIRTAGVEDCCSVLVMDSIRAAKLFREQPIDVLHIDGNHTEEASCADVYAYFPLVKSGGYVWFDDTDWVTTAKAIDLLTHHCSKVKDVGTCALFRKH